MTNNLPVRIDAIDWMKGLCITSIVFLHIEDGVLPNWLDRFIGLFMISGFYVTSGWLHGLKPTSSINLREFSKRRFKSIGVPYLWFTGIILLFDVFFCVVGHYTWFMLFRDAYKAVVLRGIGTLWFLPVLFFGELLFVTCRKFNKFHAGMAIAFIGILITDYVMNLVSTNIAGMKSEIILAPLKMVHQSMRAWLIISISCMVSMMTMKANWQGHKRWIGVAMSCLTLALFIFFCYKGQYWDASYNNAVGFFANILEPLSILFVLIAIKTSNVVLNYLRYWGKNSIILMTVHYSILMELIIWLYTSAMGYPPYGWITLVCFVAIMLLQYPIAEFINRKCKYIIGR